MDLSLLLTEWQGYGVDSAVAAGARGLAERLGERAFVEVEAPLAESLVVEDGVLGLSSIAPRVERALDLIARANPDRIFTVGGTCGVELAPVSFLNARYHGDLAVVWFDAHADLNTPASSPSAHFHGMVLRTLLGAGPAPLVRALPRLLVPGQIVLAGARDLDRDEATFVSDTAISLLTPADLRVPDRVTGRVRTGGYTRLYLHLDLDVLDPVEFPDSLVHAPHGPSVEEVAETIQDLVRSFDIVGFSVVEFRPRSADAMARVLHLLDRTGIDIGVLGPRATVRT